MKLRVFLVLLRYFCRWFVFFPYLSNRRRLNTMGKKLSVIFNKQQSIVRTHHNLLNIRSVWSQPLTNVALNVKFWICDKLFMFEFFFSSVKMRSKKEFCYVRLWHQIKSSLNNNATKVHWPNAPCASLSRARFLLNLLFVRLTKHRDFYIENDFEAIHDSGTLEQCEMICFKWFLGSSRICYRSNYEEVSKINSNYYHFNWTHFHF